MNYPIILCIILNWREYLLLLVPLDRLGHFYSNNVFNLIVLYRLYGICGQNNRSLLNFGIYGSKWFMQFGPKIQFRSVWECLMFNNHNRVMSIDKFPCQNNNQGWFNQVKLYYIYLCSNFISCCFRGIYSTACLLYKLIYCLQELWTYEFTEE